MLSPDSHFLYGLSLPQQVAASLGHGRYEPVELLGAGGMAYVYKALDTRLDVMRAVKVLRPDLDETARQRFFNEARTMAKLHHKNVVLVHDVADDGQSMFLVMELIEGGSMADRLEALGPLPPRMACEVVLATLGGLGAAHAKGVVHRDVKPHNLLVDSEGTPKVTDFGIAQVSEVSNTRTGAVIGTWAYMAPEQRSDAKNVDLRADVYAVGCTLYNLVTGTDPFDLYNREIYAKLFKDVPAPFRPVIQRATRYDPDDRFQTTEAFAAALREVIDELPEDPEDTPPLGAFFARERPSMEDVVGTVLSNPTLHSPSQTTTGARQAPPPLPAEPTVRDWIPAVGFGVAAAVAFAMIGVGLGGLLAGGTWVVVGVPEADGPPPEVAPAFAPELEALLPGDVLEVERTEGAAPPPVSTRDPEDALPPVPRPTGGFPVTIRARPAGTLIEIRGDYQKDRWSGTLPRGSHLMRLRNDAKGLAWSWTLPVNNPIDTCFDVATEGPCR